MCIYVCIFSHPTMYIHVCIFSHPTMCIHVCIFSHPASPDVFNCMLSYAYSRTLHVCVPLLLLLLWYACVRKHIGIMFVLMYTCMYILTPYNVYTSMYILTPCKSCCSLLHAVVCIFFHLTHLCTCWAGDKRSNRQWSRKAENCACGDASKQATRYLGFRSFEVYAHMYAAYIHSCIRTCVHTCMLCTQTHTSIHSYICLCVHACVLHTYTHKHKHTYKQTNIHSHIRTYVHTYTYAYAFANVRVLSYCLMNL